MLQPGRYYYVIVGDAPSIRPLTRAFEEPSLRVFEYEGCFVLDAESLQLGGADYKAADALIKVVEGSARLSGHTIVGDLGIGGSLYQEPNGGPLMKGVRVHASLALSSAAVCTPTILINGVPQPKPRSLETRVALWLPTASKEASALHAMFLKDELDWRDLYVVAEILLSFGYPKRKGIQNQVDLVKRTAGNWEVLGPEARHYDQGHVAPKDPPTLEEARTTILGLVREWFEESAP